MEKRLLTVDEATVYLGYPSAKALRQAMYRRDVPFVKRGRTVRLDRRDLDRMIDAQKIDAAS